MKFVFPREARSGFFKHIVGEFKLTFDMYYLCLIAGLTARRRETPSDASDLVDNFPDAYESRGKLIVALFLARELADMSVKMTDRQSVHKAVAQLVSIQSPYLSDHGMREFNRYMYGGYLLLTERFPEKPRSLETFLPLYKQLLDEEMEQQRGNT
jgi:hypothetical protein